MKRRDLIRYLAGYGCYLQSEGAKHSRFVNLADARKKATVPRHRELDDFLVRLICRQLGIPPPF